MIGKVRKISSSEKKKHRVRKMLKERKKKRRVRKMPKGRLKKGRVRKMLKGISIAVVMGGYAKRYAKWYRRKIGEAWTIALTAKFHPYGTIFHLILELLVDAESDEAACLVKKLTSMVVPETWARCYAYGETVLCLCAMKGNLKASESSSEV